MLVYVMMNDRWTVRFVPLIVPVTGHMTRALATAQHLLPGFTIHRILTPEQMEGYPNARFV